MVVTARRPAPPARLTAQEYLAAEAQSPLKHEYVAGELYAMSGVRLDHGRIALNLATALRSGLRGSGCEVFVSDVKVHVAAEDAYFYPDVVVTCDPGDRRAEYVIEAPTLVAEVLSPSTEAWDRGTKVPSYIQLPSLRDVLLIAQHRPRVEHFRRSAEGIWELWLRQGDDEIPLGALPVRMRVADLYEGVVWEAPGGEGSGSLPAPPE